MIGTGRLRASAALAAFLGLSGCSQMGGCGGPPAQARSSAAAAPAPSGPSRGASFSSPADMSGQAGGAARVSRFDSAPRSSSPGQAAGLPLSAAPAAASGSASAPPDAPTVVPPPSASQARRPGVVAASPAASASAAPAAPAAGRDTVLSIAGAVALLLGLVALLGLRRRGGKALLRGQYELGDPIGEGGMGVVLEGTDVSLGRKVAIKRMREDLRRDPRERRRFLEEARLVAALHHPNIVDIYSIVEEGDDIYLIFEHIDGRTLSRLLADEGRLSLADARALLRGVADALDFAHSRGVIHRDLKPSNVMVDAQGRARVMDFGIARAAKDALSRQAMTDTIVGTPPYMAPEQEQGAVRRESDVYALGVCLYELLTGALPFSGTGAGMLLSKMNGTFAPPSTLGAGLPAGLDAVLAKALDPQPEKRFTSAGRMIAALSAL